mgnify:CR=1 FL=1
MNGERRLSDDENKVNARRAARDKKLADYKRHHLASSGCCVVAGLFLWFVEKHLQWVSWRILASDIAGTADVSDVTGGGDGQEIEALEASTLFSVWRMHRGAVQCHLDCNALQSAFRAAGVDLSADPTISTHDTRASAEGDDGNERLAHPLVRFCAQ